MQLYEGLLDEDDKKPLSKRFKISTLPTIEKLIPLSSFVPEHLQKSVKDFTNQLFRTTSSKFSPTLPREPTPPRDPSKGKEVAIIKEQVNKLVPFQEKGGSNPKMPNIKSFITLEGLLSQDKIEEQLREFKRLANLKAEKDKLEEELRKLLNPATLKAQTHKWTEHEAKKAMMIKDYNHQISFRADPLPITIISYIVNQHKEATMKIIVNQAKRLGLPPPPALATFGMTAEEKKKKRKELIKKVFVTEDVRVDGMGRNLIPPLGVVPIQGLVISEPESGIFFMNGNTDIGFHRESESYLAPTTELIRLQNQIKVDLEVAKEMFRKMIYVIEARDDCNKARKIVEKNLDNLGLPECKASESNVRRIQVKGIIKEVEDHLKTYSLAGMDISWKLQSEGEGLGHPSEPQPPPSIAQPTNEEPIPTVVSLSHQKTQTPRQALKEVTELPQTSKPIPNVPDEAVYEEWDDRVRRATTTAASLDVAHASGNITKTQPTTIPNVSLSQEIGTGGSPTCQEAMGGSIAQTRYEKVPTQSYDSPLPRVNKLGSDEGSMTLHELTVLCT
ncbi:hypothetical protein Tco_0726631 [Tanacetum coccineum]|uniref:Uncharacterized protein n=1 Tax=Tanacetum coccineum TaxID=301880 RepID=A0ABQ4YIF7_9ASTR